MVSAARIRLDLCDLSNGYFAPTFLSSSPTTPATQSGLHELTCELGSRGGAQPNLRPARSEGAGFVTLNSSPVIAAGLLLRSSTGLGHDHSEPDPARPRPSGDLDGARWTKGLSS